VTPWQAAGFDLAAVIALLIWQPKTGMFASPWGLAYFAPYLLGTALILAVLGSWVNYQFGSLTAALAYVHGDAIAVVPRSLDVGEEGPGEVRVVNVELVNLTDHEIAILGAAPICGCIPTDDLPLTLPGGTSRAIRVRVGFIGDQSDFTRQILLYTDDQNQPNVVFWLSGRIRPAH
jgi:hypothetical protein